MDEQEFDALASSRGFRKWGAPPEGARSRRSDALATWLFGMTPDDLRLQLLASHPEIPRGYNLADFQRLWLYLELLTHDLNRTLKMLPGQLKNPRNTLLSHLGVAAFGVIEVGAQRLSVWEARIEIVRRAIDYLENR